jgi:hypothetical protein
MICKKGSVTNHRAATPTTAPIFNQRTVRLLRQVSSLDAVETTSETTIPSAVAKTGARNKRTEEASLRSTTAAATTAAEIDLKGEANLRPPNAAAKVAAKTVMMGTASHRSPNIAARTAVTAMEGKVSLISRSDAKIDTRAIETTTLKLTTAAHPHDQPIVQAAATDETQTRARRNVQCRTEVTISVVTHHRAISPLIAQTSVVMRKIGMRQALQTNFRGKHRQLLGRMTFQNRNGPLQRLINGRIHSRKPTRMLHATRT